MFVSFQKTSSRGGGAADRQSEQQSTEINERGKERDQKQAKDEKEQKRPLVSFSQRWII